ncbi:hypothetical protein FOL47_008508 [Perkinsus chesapeaki]|uniref:Uncharacterized protein n=1 Tax=Perkinsus chesapeaki TaxID=330153 RepID=A0A7J6MTK6_PERCH|nr:hypothetical protein FOL47_008508 [Perkinsus chesapeaki]
MFGKKDDSSHSSAGSSSNKKQSVSSMATASDAAPLTRLYDLQKRRQKARDTRRMVAAASNYPPSTLSRYYTASEYGIVGYNNTSMASFPPGATSVRSMGTSRSCYAPVLTPSPASRSGMPSMYPQSPPYNQDFSGPVMLPRVGVPLPPREIASGYYYGPSEELAAPPPPPHMKTSYSCPRPAAVPAVDLGLSMAAEEVFEEEPEPSRVRLSVTHECSATRSW